MATTEKAKATAKKKPGPTRVYEHRFPIRARGDEVRRLKARAKAAGLSLSRYLVECGLSNSNHSDPADPDRRERQEKALFYLRKVEGELSRLLRTGRGGELKELIEQTRRIVHEVREQFGK